MKKYFVVNIFILLLSSISVARDDIALPEISQDVRDLVNETVKSKARVEAFNIQKPTVDQTLKNKINKISKQSNQHAEKYRPTVKNLVDKTINNKSWKFKQSQLIKEINKDLGVDDEQIKSVSGHRLYLFASSSMPKDSMRRYARHLQRYPNSQIVMRGFIGGGKKMRPTMAYIKSIISKNEDCNGVHCKIYNTKVNIDPVLFQRYNITKVPTLVYVDELSGANYCSEGNTNIVNARGVHKFIGLAPVKYMIRELSEATNLTKLKDLAELEQ